MRCSEGGTARASCALSPPNGPLVSAQVLGVDVPYAYVIGTGEPRGLLSQGMWPLLHSKRHAIPRWKGQPLCPTFTMCRSLHTLRVRSVQFTLAAAALAVGVGAYAYETLVVAREDMRPLAEEWVRRPDIKSLQ